MPELPDFDLQRTATTLEEPAPPPVHPITLWVSAGLFAAAVGVAMFIAFSPRPLPAPASDSIPKADVALDASPPRSLGGKAEQIAVPPLD